MPRRDTLRDLEGRQHDWILDQAVYCLERAQWRSALAIVWGMHVYSPLRWQVFLRYQQFRDAILDDGDEDDIREHGRELMWMLGDIQVIRDKG